MEDIMAQAAHLDTTYLALAFRCGPNRERIADTLTVRHSAFESFEALCTAKGSYRPSLCMRSPERIWLANYYDEVMQEVGDERRAYRYGAETPEGQEAQAALTEALVEARLIEPERVVVQAPTKCSTLRGPGGIRLVLDPNDRDTAAVVYSPFMRHAASYWVALDQSALSGHGRYEDEEFKLNSDQLRWLESQNALVEATESAARPEGWDQ